MGIWSLFSVTIRRLVFIIPLTALVLVTACEQPTGSSKKTVEPPVATPLTGSYDSNQTVTLVSATADAIIYYTLDGSNPTTSNMKYTDPIVINETVTLKAMAVRSGMKNSRILVETYTITKVSMPQADPIGGKYDAAQSVSLSTETPGATIHYTLNGLIPTTASAVYTSLIEITSTTTLRAIAVKSDMEASAYSEDRYVIEYPILQVAMPISSPKAGNYDEAQSVSLATATEDATIYYTLDGSIPTAASEVYTSPIAIPTPTTLKAVGIKSGSVNSAVFTAQYNISGNASYAVTFDSSGGSAVEPQTIPAGGKAWRPPNPTKSVFYFAGWYEDSAFTKQWAFAHDSVNANLTLYAKWNNTFIATSVEDLRAFLADKTGTLENPLPVKMDMYLPNDVWQFLITTLEEKNIFVTLDLSSCTTKKDDNIDNSFGFSNAYMMPGKSLIMGIHLPEDVTDIGSGAFADCTNLAWVTLPENLSTIGSSAFSGCTNLALTALPENLSTIGNLAFYGCRNLALTALPANLTTIGDYAFAGCTNLALTALPANLTAIGSYAFRGCRNLALTALPANLTTIGDYAFAGCTRFNFTQISIPAGVTSIGNAAFYMCTNLSIVTCHAVTPPKFGYGVFSGGNGVLPNLKQIKVPSESVEAYKVAEGWSVYKSRITGF